MAGTVVTDSLEQLQEQRKGFIQISLTDFDVITASEIALGSRIEISGSVIKFTADESMGLNWSSMSAGTVYAYISGSTYASAYSATAPVWNTEKQGWYDATGTDRCYARLIKDASANYTQKTLYSNIRNILHTDQGLVFDRNVFNSLRGGSVSFNTFFDTLSPFVPNVGDKMQISGGIKYSSDSNVYYMIERYSSTVIKAYDTKYNSLSITDGSATLLDEVCIIW